MKHALYTLGWFIMFQTFSSEEAIDVVNLVIKILLYLKNIAGKGLFYSNCGYGYKVRFSYAG